MKYHAASILVKDFVAWRCTSECCVAPGADTPVCPYVFHGARWRGAPACAPDGGLVQNGGAHPSPG
jgi:hypothetical protein